MRKFYSAKFYTICVYTKCTLLMWTFISDDTCQSSTLKDQDIFVMTLMGIHLGFTLMCIFVAS